MATSFLPLSYSTTSLFTTCSPVCRAWWAILLMVGGTLCVPLKGTQVQEVMRMRWESFPWTRMGSYPCSSLCLDWMNPIAVLTTRFHEQHDHRIPPAERLKHLYRLLEQPYDLTGRDHYDQSALHVYGSTGGIRNKRDTLSSVFAASRVSELGSTSSQFEQHMTSPDPINEVFYHLISLPPISTWGIDWSR